MSLCQGKRALAHFRVLCWIKNLVQCFLKNMEGPWMPEPLEVLTGDGRSQAGNPHLTSPQMIPLDRKV